MTEKISKTYAKSQEPAYIHDPLCRAKYQEWEQYLPCLDCELIKKVRAADMRYITEVVRAAYMQGLMHKPRPGGMSDLTIAEYDPAPDAE